MHNKQPFTKTNTEVICIKNFRPHQNALNTLRLTVALLTLILSVAGVYFLKSYATAMYISVGAVCCLAFLGNFILLPLYFSKCSFNIAKDSATKNGGVFFTTTAHVKKSSVQYVTVVKTPFSKYTAMNFLIIHVLGGVMILNFLSLSDLEEIGAIMQNWAEGGGN